MDKSERLYHGPKHRTGFLADDIIRERGLVQHHFLLGKVLPEFLPEIGTGIDFMVLDTVHSLPGELLDFLCVLPYLKDGAVVCLHDVNLCHWMHWPDAVATNVLLHSIVAEHILPTLRDGFGERKLANIAAFRITPETREHIINVFLALTMPWAYVPVAGDLLAYSRFIREHYDDELFDIYKATLHAQDAGARELLGDYLATDKRVMIYGASSRGRQYYDALRRPMLHNEVTLVDRAADAWNEVFDYDVKTLSAVSPKDYDIIYIAITKFDIANEVYQSLLSMGVADEKVVAIV